MRSRDLRLATPMFRLKPGSACHEVVAWLFARQRLATVP